MDEKESLPKINPAKGNINLYISIEEAEEILRGMQAMNYNSTNKGLKGKGKNYELGELNDCKEVVRFYELDLIGLLTAPRGFYALRDESRSITNQDKWRVELKQVDECWEIDK